MADIGNKIRLLQMAPPSRVAAVLLQTLRHAGQDELVPILEALIASDDRAANIEIISLLDRLPEKTRKLVVRISTKFDEAIESVLHDGDRQARINAMSLMSARADATHRLRIMAQLSRDDDEAVAEAAARTVTTIARRHVGPHGRRACRADAHRFIDDAVAALLSAHRTHRREESLLAAALLLRRPGTHVRSLLDDPEHPDMFLLRRAVSMIDHPIVMRNLLSWLIEPSIVRSVLRQVPNVARSDDFDSFMASGHLLRHPLRRKALRQSDRSDRCLPDLQRLEHLETATQRAMPDYIVALEPAGTRRTLRLSEMILLADPVARFNALRYTWNHDSDEARSAAVRSCCDANQHVRSSALRDALTHSQSSTSIQPAHAEQCSQTLQHRMMMSTARVDLQTFFENFWDMTDAERAWLSHMWHTQMPDQLREHMQSALHTNERPMVLAAIWMIRRCGLEVGFVQHLLSLIGSTDTHIASAALSAVARCGGRHAVQVIVESIGHEHFRMRANAIDALRLADPQAAVDRVRPLLADSSNRVRASAIRVLTEHDDFQGELALREMLADRDPLHRISAVWAARRSGASYALPAIRRLAANDPAPLVRTRALHATRFLKRSVRTAANAA